MLADPRGAFHALQCRAGGSSALRLFFQGTVCLRVLTNLPTSGDDTIAGRFG